MPILTSFFRSLLPTLALGFLTVTPLYAQTQAQGDLSIEKRERRIAVGAHMAYNFPGGSLRYGPFQAVVGGYESGYYSARYNHILITRGHVDLYVFLAGSVAQYERRGFILPDGSGMISDRSGTIIAIEAGHGSEFYLLKNREGFSISIETGTGTSLLGGDFRNYPRSLFAAFGLHYHF